MSEIKENRIVFVDDDKDVLAAIENEMADAEFSIELFSNTSDAYSFIFDNKVSILISDLRMPVRDGFWLLEKCHQEFPEMGRVILSNYDEKETVIRALTKGLASAYLTKPWEDGHLLENITHMIKVRANLQNNKLLAKVSQIEKLPGLPQIYKKVANAIGADKSVKEIATIVKQDVSIAAKVLQLANSAFYGFRPTSSMIRAIMVLGFQTLRDVVLTESLTDQMSWSDEQLLILEEISLHSLLVNRCNVEYYLMKNGRPIPIEYASVGITHDIGKLILLQYFPEMFKEIRNGLKENDFSFYKTELALGYENETHSEIGSFFLKTWNLPDSNCEVSLYHHRPNECSPRFKLLLESVNFADEFSNYIYRNRRNPDIDLGIFLKYGIEMEQINQLAEKVRAEMARF